MKTLFSFKLIYHLLLLSCYKICFKAEGNFKTLSIVLELKLEVMSFKGLISAKFQNFDADQLHGGKCFLVSEAVLLQKNFAPGQGF